MVACRLQMYSFIGPITDASKASATDDNSHPPYPTLCAVIPEIRHATLRWNPSITFSIT